MLPNFKFETKNADLLTVPASSPSTYPKLEEGVGRRRRCGGHLCANLLIGFGALLVVLGIVYGAGMPAYVNKAVDDQAVTCTAEDGAKQAYTDPYSDCDDCSPYYVSVNLLNATNAEEWLAGSADKLEVQEMGPYVYRRREIKLNVTFDDNYRVSYKKYTYHTYEPSLSCEGCSDSDEVTTFDVGYLSVISTTGGEFNLLAAVAQGSFGAAYNTSELVATIGQYGPQMMRWMNGLNSLNPAAMKTVAANSAVLLFLAKGPTAIADMDLTGFAYNGLFVTRTVSQWALGYPSLLAGLILGSNYVGSCVGDLNEQCATLTGDEYAAIASSCATCASGAAVVAANNYTCAIIEELYAAEYGAEEAASFVATTCELCTTYGICAMPLPGIAESSGMNYTATAPDESTLNTYIQRTGCDDLTQIGQYEQYDGATTNPVWVTLDERRNPTLAEIIAFSSYADCDAPTANLTCFNVTGSDGTSLKPGGVSITGFADETTVDSFSTYLGPAEMTVEITSFDEEVDFSDVTLHRFGTPNDIFVSTSENAYLGRGYPVDGLQPLTFITGFLSYMSGPFFIHGDSSLYENVAMTNSEGVAMTQAELYESDGSTLKEDYRSAYGTFVDIESGTGKTMRAFKRSMVSYALAASVANSSASMSDVLFPSLPINVVLPSYWAQENGQAKDSLLDTFKSTVTLIKTFLPVMIVLLVVGLGLVGGGVFLRRRNNQNMRGHASSVI